MLMSCSNLIYWTNHYNCEICLAIFIKLALHGLETVILGSICWYSIENKKTSRHYLLLFACFSLSQNQNPN